MSRDDVKCEEIWWMMYYSKIKKPTRKESCWIIRINTSIQETMDFCHKIIGFTQLAFFTELWLQLGNFLILVRMHERDKGLVVVGFSTFQHAILKLRDWQEPKGSIESTLVE